MMSVPDNLPLREAFRLALEKPYLRFSFTPEESQAVIDALDRRMTEDEILQRARRAVDAGAPSDDGLMSNTRFTGTIYNAVVAIVAQAVRDLDKPLVDPVVLACREIVAKRYDSDEQPVQARYARAGDLDGGIEMTGAIAAYRAGQDSIKQEVVEAARG